ncbi:hypothetical protein E2C01_049373 [Portunus trituberculatus]|uniref:Uncharacterized protein n=1 Tax=Portunus trituberculatus TaxID=210409 RepID=A0A5B7GE88_PORTR|nr:hypothetical protein [Portunus trituberculatus]
MGVEHRVHPHKRTLLVMTPPLLHECLLSVITGHHLGRRGKGGLSFEDVMKKSSGRIMLHYEDEVAATLAKPECRTPKIYGAMF